MYCLSDWQGENKFLGSQIWHGENKFLVSKIGTEKTNFWSGENKFLVSQTGKEKTNFCSPGLARRKQIPCLSVGPGENNFLSPSDWQGENKFLVSQIGKETTYSSGLSD